MSIRILIKDYPRRTIALTTATHALTFEHSPFSAEQGNGSYGTSPQPLSAGGSAGGGHSSGATSGAPQCIVEFSPLEKTDLHDYRQLSSQSVHGTLGLITVQNDVFLCIVSAATKVATVRPGETVLRILAVEFRKFPRARCLQKVVDQGGLR